MKFSDKTLSQTVTQLCLIKEIDHVVISPGSRNAPLTIGFTHHPSFKNFSIVDERVAGFFALGMAQQLKRPVALVCTSGSAVLNYFPAISEAFYSDIPLVVISADRPAGFIDVGDGQTIRQEGVFYNHILYSANCIEGEEQQLRNETMINVALNTAIELNGPVHINVPFSEPLYGTVDDMNVRPQHVPAREPATVFTENYGDFLRKWNRAGRKMILTGVMEPGSLEEKHLQHLAEDPGVVVLTETTSNLHHPSFFPSIDQLIASLNDQEFEALKPEVLLTMGGMIVSKKVKAFLRKFKPESHAHIGPKRAFDTFFSLEYHFKTTPHNFFREFFKKARISNSDYRDHWLAVRDYRLHKQQEFTNEVPYSDFAVFFEIFRSLQSARLLHLANSATIRYSQLFNLNPELEVYCNRGTSGIDGSTATAIGAACISDKPTVFLTGDLSFFYDSNALWNNYIPTNFRIIVVNNSGGGIFRILPGAKETEKFEPYFETRHSLDASYLCAMFGFDYRTAEDIPSLKQALREFYLPSRKPVLLEVFTPAEINDQVLMDYFDFIK